MQTFQELVVGYQFLRSKFAKCYKKHVTLFFFVTESLILSVSEVSGWAVGKAVASDTRDPRLASLGWQILLTNRTIQTTNIKKKEAGNCPPLKKNT